MSDRGWRKFDELKGEDGTKCLIRVNHESGEFRATVRPQGEQDTSYSRPVFDFRAKTLEEVKEAAQKYLADTLKLEWRPMIVIFEPSKRGRWETEKGPDENHVSLRYERYFVAIRVDGSRIWKDWKAVYSEEDKKRAVDRMETLVGEPGYATDRENYAYTQLIDYTPARWSALRLMSHAIRELNRKLDHEFLGKDLNGFLEAVAERGNMMFLPGPTPKKEKA